MPRAKAVTKTEETVKPTKTAGLSVAVLDMKGVASGQKELPKEIFHTEVNEKLLAQYVRVYLANQRQGNASSKTRGEVSGSTRKIYKQKGTGNARHGSIKAPIFVGGGIVGGPQPRDYSLRMNQKQRVQALFSALTLKMKDKAVYGLSNKLMSIEPKTKIMVQLLNAAGFVSQKLLVVVPKMEKNNLFLSGRNIDGLSFVSASSINAYEVLNANKVLFVEDAVDVLSKHFSKKS